MSKKVQMAGAVGPPPPPSRRRCPSNPACYCLMLHEQATSLSLQIITSIITQLHILIISAGPRINHIMKLPATALLLIGSRCAATNEATPQLYDPSNPWGSMAGYTPFSVPQPFMRELTDQIFGSEALVRAKRWVVEDRQVMIISIASSQDARTNNIMLF